MATDYGGPERRVEPRDEAFERAVREAARMAAQQVAKVHRVQLVTQAFLAALTVSLLVATIIGVVFRSAAIAQARREGRIGCQLVRDLSSTLGDYIATDARVRSRQGKGNIQEKLIADLGRVVSLGDLRAAAGAAAQANSETVHYWETVDLPQLRRLATRSCDALS